MTENQNNYTNPDRQDRFVSHALVEIRKFKRLPFFVQSGILLDMSTAGFKVELTANQAKAMPGDMFWLHIPLSPFGIRSPSDLSCKVEVRWFDPKGCRLGGIFVDLDHLSLMTIEQIVSKLREAGNRI